MKLKQLKLLTFLCIAHMRVTNTHSQATVLNSFKKNKQKTSKKFIQFHFEFCWLYLSYAYPQVMCILISFPVPSVWNGTATLYIKKKYIGKGAKDKVLDIFFFQILFLCLF